MATVHRSQAGIYSLRSKLLVAEMDVCRTKIHLDTSISMTSILVRREYIAWKVLGALSHFCWWEKYASQNVLSLNFCFELRHLYKSLLPSAKGLLFTLCNFFILLESPSSLIKHQLRGTMIVFEHWV